VWVEERKERRWVGEIGEMKREETDRAMTGAREDLGTV